MNDAVARLIDNGRRLHLHHGPIDLIIEAEGIDVKSAYQAAVIRFKPLLQELVDELPMLRTATDSIKVPAGSSVAKRMVTAAGAIPDTFTTPMIAVAGSVADEVLDAMEASGSLNRACVNNGGDIAFYLRDGQSYKTGIVADPRKPEWNAIVSIDASSNTRGIATSGRHGRSLSAGIADAVTVLAADAAQADTAATIIANAVNLDNCPAVSKVPATDIDPDSDLGDMLVTIDVAALSGDQIESALDHGVTVATKLLRQHLIHAAYLHLHGIARVVPQHHTSTTRQASARIEEMSYA